jgi:pyruvate dehydrogenase E2 component (dihydrolipoamide acetyltransferase)
VPIEVIMPALGMSQDTGLLLAWLKHEGDTVQKGEPIMEIETDKATVEVEAQGDGTLANVTAQEGDEVPVGDVIALILKAGEAVPEPMQSVSEKPDPQPTHQVQTVSASNGKTPTPVAVRVAAAHEINLANVPASGNRITRADVEAYLENRASVDAIATTTKVVLASPKARRLAREREFELVQITGSGPDGAVLAADVLAYHEADIKTSMPKEPATITTKDSPAISGDVQTGRMWQRMAQRLTDSWQTIPHFYLKREVNVSQLITWRTRLKQRADINVTYTDLLVQVVAKALQKHPYVNGCWNGEGVVFNDAINVGLAVAVDEGLLVPVIHNADQRGLVEIAEARAGIVNRALDNKLKPNDLQGGTFTISNLGMYGIDEFAAIVNPPQAAILAVGNIVEKVVPVDGEAIVQPILTLSLSCDHRAVDGARGADFLRTLANYMQDPMQMMD